MTHTTEVQMVPNSYLKMWLVGWLIDARTKFPVFFSLNNSNWLVVQRMECDVKQLPTYQLKAIRIVRSLNTGDAKSEHTFLFAVDCSWYTMKTLFELLLTRLTPHIIEEYAHSHSTHTRRHLTRISDYC